MNPTSQDVTQSHTIIAIYEKLSEMQRKYEATFLNQTMVQAGWSNKVILLFHLVI